MKKYVAFIFFIVIIILNSLCFAYDEYDINNDVNNDSSQVNEYESSNENTNRTEIDLTEINNILTINFGHIKAYLFLICLYLSCKVIYGVVWWLYNKTLL